MAPSLNGVSEGSGVLANAAITRDHRHEGWRFGQGCGGRQMDSIQSTDGFHRKRLSGMRENRLSDAHDMTTAREPLERQQCSALLLHGYPAGEVSAEESAARFRECDG